MNTTSKNNNLENSLSTPPPRIEREKTTEVTTNRIQEIEESNIQLLKNKSQILLWI